MNQILRELSSVYIADGFTDDCEELIQRCARVVPLTYCVFAEIWKEMNFAGMYKDRSSSSEIAELSEEAVNIAKHYMVNDTSNYEESVAGLFLVYALVNLQPYTGFAALRLTPQEVPAISRIEVVARRERRFDVLRVLADVLIKGPTQYHAAERPRGLEPCYTKYFGGTTIVDAGGLRPRGVFQRQNEALDVIRELKAMLKRYQDAKAHIGGKSDRNLSYLEYDVPDYLEASLKSLINGITYDVAAQADSEEIDKIQALKKHAMENTVDGVRCLTGVAQRKKKRKKDYANGHEYIIPRSPCKKKQKKREKKLVEETTNNVAPAQNGDKSNDESHNASMPDLLDTAPAVLTVPAKDTAKYKSNKFKKYLEIEKEAPRLNYNFEDIDKQSCPTKQAIVENVRSNSEKVIATNQAMVDNGNTKVIATKQGVVNNIKDKNQIVSPTNQSTFTSENKEVSPQKSSPKVAVGNVMDKNDIVGPTKQSTVKSKKKEASPKKSSPKVAIDNVKDKSGIVSPTKQSIVTSKKKEISPKNVSPKFAVSRKRRAPLKSNSKAKRRRSNLSTSSSEDETDFELVFNDSEDEAYSITDDIDDSLDNDITYDIQKCLSAKTVHNSENESESIDNDETNEQSVEEAEISRKLSEDIEIGAPILIQTKNGEECIEIEIIDRNAEPEFNKTRNLRRRTNTDTDKTTNLLNDKEKTISSAKNNERDKKKLKTYGCSKKATAKVSNKKTNTKKSKTSKPRQISKAKKYSVDDDVTIIKLKKAKPQKPPTMIEHNLAEIIQIVPIDREAHRLRKARGNKRTVTKKVKSRMQRTGMLHVADVETNKINEETVLRKSPRNHKSS